MLEPVSQGPERVALRPGRRGGGGGPARGPARAATGRRAVALLPQTRLDRGPRTPDEQAGGVGVSGCRGVGGRAGLARRSGAGRREGPRARPHPHLCATSDDRPSTPPQLRMKRAGRPERTERTEWTVRTPSEARPHVASGDIRLRGDEARWLAARPGSPVAVKAALRHVPNRAARTLLPNAHILSHYVTGKFFSGRFVMLLFTILNSYSSTFKSCWARFRCCAGCAGRETR